MSAPIVGRRATAFALPASWAAALCGPSSSNSCAQWLSVTKIHSSLPHRAISSKRLALIKRTSCLIGAPGVPLCSIACLGLPKARSSKA